MNKYEIIIFWSEDDNAYIAEVPELPGCMADGNSYNEVLENIQIVMQEWIDMAKSINRSIPEPKGRLKYA
jgi:predicted RNase H-like HicB family nuclease